ncbi:Uma2 family endonuclease [Limnofasciculus baicalensis]|uniref:Uma2 family endonuclease n=1 Tax=Limnofasciculus baicalensis BBK-W-15 TaxID=2699891 RepID=A0AAE3KPV0_9CYAN|nr:Uma2 family endonuclease [Limnofasciculus baicalensis]MCP2731759.1 Uma2 family endonuclease [Limnofasciculus baicalensis BBK-W-15]
MIANFNSSYISPEDYLEGEKISPIKHEYIRGEVYAMAGASKAHGIIALNFATRLKNHLRGSGSIPYTTDIKVRIEAANVYYYPDVTVTCDERDRTSLNEDFIRYPRLVVEVLSPTTAAFDRGDKFGDYRTLASLEEYVLISQERIAVECFRRNSEGRWELYVYSQGDEIHLASVDFRFPIAALYEDVMEIN